MTTSAAMSATLANDTAEIAQLASEVELFLSAAHVPDKVIFQLNLCIDELVTNTILYGYDDGAEHRIEVTVRLGEDSVVTTIEDDGRAFDPFSSHEPPAQIGMAIDDRPIGGLGIHLVATMMTEVGYDRIGDRNRVTLRRSLQEGPSKRGDGARRKAAQAAEINRRS
jgi:anti-sigma regulatory factor (Ser/Thr protein kinase)